MTFVLHIRHDIFKVLKIVIKASKSSLLSLSRLKHYLIQIAQFYLKDSDLILQCILVVIVHGMRYLVCLYNQLIKIQRSIKRIMRGEFYLCRKENSHTLSHRSPNNEDSINKFRFCNHDYDRNHPPNNDDIVVYKICATWSYIEIFESVFQNNIIQIFGS